MAYDHIAMQSIVAQYSKLRERADRIYKMKHRRAVVAYHAAFGDLHPPHDAGLDCCVIHNSLVSREQGHPWPEVNYHYMRLAKRLVDDFRPSQLCGDFYMRKTATLR